MFALHICVVGLVLMVINIAAVLFSLGFVISVAQVRYRPEARRGWATTGQGCALACSC